MSSKRIIVVLGAATVIAFGYMAYTDAVRTWQNLQDQQNQIEALDIKYNDIDEKLDKTRQEKEQSEEEVEELKRAKEELEQDRQRLREELQAKADQRASLAAASREVINVATNTSTASAAPGGCSTWLQQAGVSDPIAVELITRESGCNPCAYYPGGSDCAYAGESACGIPQANPCSKLRDIAGCAMTDAVCQLRWMQSYVEGRYGSWAAAKSHHDNVGWY